MAELDFTTTYENIADQKGNFKPGPPVGLIFFPKGTEFAATETIAKAEATYTTGLNLAEGSRWYIINFDKGVRIYQVTPTQDEPKFEESDFSGIRSKVSAGNKRLAMVFTHLAPYTLKALHALENQDLDMAIITENNYILATSQLGTIFEGFGINYFAGNQVAGENSGASEKMTVYIDFKDADEWDKYGIIALPTAFQFEDVDGIVDCEITEVAAASTLTTGIIVDVKSYVGAVGITDLVAADFTVSLVSSGADEKLDSISESTTVEGRYTLTPDSTFTAAPVLIQLTVQPDATTEGYETPTDYMLTVTPAAP